MIKCLAKDRNNNNCRNKTATDNHFCKFHQYMNEYTPDMLDHLELCKGCKKMYFFGNIETKTCESCRTRDKSKYKKEVVLCGKEGCVFQKSSENPYCGKHQLCVFVDETTEMGKKTCTNYIRGCKSQLELSYLFTKCESCLDSARIKDKLRRKKATETPATQETATCTTCCKLLPVEQFIGTKDETIITKTCLDCRKQNQIQDARRNKEHRNEIARQNIHSKYTHYMKDASRRNLVFQITEDQFTDIIYQNCNYCGIIEDIGFNGIDRVNSGVGYVVGNMVGCCKTCNYMKGSLTVDAFLQRVHHILSVHNEIKDGQLFPLAFGDSKGGSYDRYHKNATFRNIPFCLSRDEFDEIVKNPCYICKKENTTTHQNGIDRKINTIGYTVENSNSCCAECNFMKRDFDYDVIMDKIRFIYGNNMEFDATLKNHMSNKRFTNVRKPQK